MRRPAHSENTLKRIHGWRRDCPDLTLRSTFIVGFPGETEAEFNELLQWLDEAQLDRIGCFKYSPVDGAGANALADHVPESVKDERYSRFMERAQTISAARLAARIGKRARVLIDRVEKGIATARSEGDAPDIDGVVRIKVPAGARAKLLRAGEFAEVEITAADEYDLEAELVG
jgi:ribosomal protein S12 methylthiotransferase